MTAAATDGVMVPAGDRPTAVATQQPSYAQGFDGMATEPFPEAARKVLAEPVDDAAVEIKPDGIVYVPGVYYRRQLTRAFGAGGWAIVPRMPARVMGDVVVYPGALYALGRFVAEAVGECTYRQNSNMSYASCVEGAKTDALSRCCKDLGMATELWDKAWRERWQAQYAESYWGEKWDAKKQAMVKKQMWRLRDGRPVQEINLMAGAGGVAPAASPKETTPASPAVAPPSVPAATRAPAASVDTGEALGAEGVRALRDNVKRLKWKGQFAKIWLKERFGVDAPEALSQKQGANALVLLGLFGKPAYDGFLATLVAEGAAQP